MAAAINLAKIGKLDTALGRALSKGLAPLIVTLGSAITIRRAVNERGRDNTLMPSWQDLGGYALIAGVIADVSAGEAMYKWGTDPATTATLTVVETQPPAPPELLDMPRPRDGVVVLLGDHAGERFRITKVLGTSGVFQCGLASTVESFTDGGAGVPAA